MERPSQMFVYRLSPFLFSLLAIFSPFPQTESLRSQANNETHVGAVMHAFPTPVEHSLLATAFTVEFN